MFLFLLSDFPAVVENEGGNKMGKRQRRNPPGRESSHCPQLRTEEREKNSHFQFHKQGFAMHAEKLRLRQHWTFHLILLFPIAHQRKTNEINPGGEQQKKKVLRLS